MQIMWLLFSLIQWHWTLRLQAPASSTRLPGFPHLPLAPHTSFLGEYNQWFQMPEPLQAGHEQWPVPKHVVQGSRGLELINPPGMRQNGGKN